MDYKKLKIVLEDSCVLVLVAEGDGDLVLVSFTGIGHALGGIDVQKPEFLSTCQFGKIIFVIDKNRSWGNSLDIETITNKILELSDGKSIITLGNSMGGFLSILFSSYLSAEKAISFTPQWSVHSEIVPEEKRWLNYRDSISNFRFVDLRGCFLPSCQYFVFFGSSETERIHSKFFDQVENIAVMKIKGTTHNVASYLKEKGCLETLIKACLFGNCDLKTILVDRQVEFK